MKKNAVFTAADAATKVCCGPQAVAFASLQVGDDSTDGRPLRCSASRCMAWRWHTTHIADPTGGPDLVESHDTYGYCGLAGAP